MVLKPRPGELKVRGTHQLSGDAEEEALWPRRNLRSHYVISDKIEVTMTHLVCSTLAVLSPYWRVTVTTGKPICRVQVSITVLTSISLARVPSLWPCSVRCRHRSSWVAALYFSWVR